MCKVLLLTGFSTDLRYGGGAIVRSLLVHFAPGELSWFSLSPPNAALEPRFGNLLVGHYSYRPFGNRRLRLAAFWAWFNRTIWPKLVATRITAALKQTGADTLWIVLDYHLVPVAAELVRQRLPQHLHFSIHDNPNEMARLHFISDEAVAAVDQGFNLVKTVKASFDVISEEMLAATGLTGRPNALVTMGCDERRRRRGITPPGKDGTLRIGHAGSYFSLERARELVEGLKCWSAETGRGWELHAFGATMPASMPPEIKWRGFFAPDALFAVISEMDILLLALDSYDTPNAPSLTCLPTKFVSYLEVGRIVLAMVPDASATARIVREASVGPVVSVSDPVSVARAIASAAAWNVDLAERGRGDLLADRFDPAAIFRRFVTLAVPGRTRDAGCQIVTATSVRKAGQC